jgi:hypothetical protein
VCNVPYNVNVIEVPQRMQMVIYFCGLSGFVHEFRSYSACVP